MSLFFYSSSASAALAAVAVATARVPNIIKFGKRFATSVKSQNPLFRESHTT